MNLRHGAIDPPACSHLAPVQDVALLDSCQHGNVDSFSADRIYSTLSLDVNRRIQNPTDPSAPTPVSAGQRLEKSPSLRDVSGGFRVGGNLPFSNSVSETAPF